MSVEIHDIVRAAREQGWRIKEIKDGLMFLPPEPLQPPITWHRTPSDWRAGRNFISRMRRAGFRWPWPAH